MPEKSDKTAVIYCRVSTAKQADEELPIQSQKQRCEDKAASLGAVVLKVYVDEGISGQSISRPAFQQALVFCEVHSPTYFITWSTSRFARNMFDSQLSKRRLSKAGTSLVYASIEIDRESQGGWLTERTMELFDEFYARQIAADTRRSMIKAAQSGYWCGGKVPFGYRVIPDSDNEKRRRLEPIPEEVTLVNLIFELRARGIGARSIAITLNADHQLNRGHTWNKTRILSLLRNQCVLGNIVFGRRLRTDGKQLFSEAENWIVVPAHKPIISREIWDKVQTILDIEAKKTADKASYSYGSPHSTYLFTGLLRCGECGGSLQIETAKGRSKRYYYYNCRNAQRNGNCKPRRLPARELDEWLFTIISNEVFTTDNLRKVSYALQELVGSWHSERIKRRSAVEDQIKSVTKRNNKLFEVLESLGRDAPNLSDIAQRLRENKSEVKKLEAEITKIDAEEPPRYQMSENQLPILAEWLVTTMRQEYNVAKTRAFFADFIDKITVEGVSVLIDYDPSKMLRVVPAASCRLVPDNLMWLPDNHLLGTTKIRRLIPARIMPGRRGRRYSVG